MTMSTQTLDEAARMLSTLLVDSIQILNVGEPVTSGIHVTRPLSPVGQPVNGLVQTTSIENTVEGRMTQTISIKVPRGTALAPGQAVKVLFCRQEPDLAGAVFLVDSISRNGLAMIRKGQASTFKAVNPEGKGGLA